MHTYFLALGLLLVIACLASAGAFMLRRRSQDSASETPRDAATEAEAIRRQRQRMARALAWRVAVSIALFVCILLAWQQGLLQPQGIPLGSR